MVIFYLMLMIVISGIAFTFLYERRKDGSTEPETIENYEEATIKTDFSEDAIQNIIDEFIFNASQSSDVEKYMRFTYEISQSENIGVQVLAPEFTGESETLLLNLVGASRTDSLDKTKFKKLILLGWETSDDVLAAELSCKKSFHESLKGNTAKFLYDSFKIYNIPEEELQCSYSLCFG